MNNIIITTFPSIIHPIGRELSIDTNTLRLGLLTPVKTTSDKMSIPLWSPTRFKGEKRASSNALDIHCLVYDIDDGESDFESWKIFGQYFLTLAHTSFSHSPDHPKYRIILPLEDPIPADDWSRACQVAFEIWDDAIGKGKPDEKALKDRARGYFRYSLPMEGREHHQIGFSGENKPKIHLDYSHIPKPSPPPPPIKRTGPISINEALLDRGVRLRLAHELRAKIMNNTARYITCPKCQRKSVYFYIDLQLNAVKNPQCNHVHSCGWWGSFNDLGL